MFMTCKMRDDPRILKTLVLPDFLRPFFSKAIPDLVPSPFINFPDRIR